MHRRVRSARTFAALVSLAALSAMAQTATTVRLDGPGTSIKITDRSKPHIVRVTAKAGEHLGVGITGLRFEPESASSIGIRVREPGGTELIGEKEAMYCRAARAQGRCDLEFTARKAGVHEFHFDGPFSATAHFDFHVSTPAAAELREGNPQAIAIKRPGQDARLAFEIQPGAQLAVHVGDVAAPEPASRFPFRLLRPDGSVAGKASAQAGVPASISLDAAAPRGRYTLEVDPEHAAVGTFMVALRPVARFDGMAVDLTPRAPNEEQRVTFQGRRGQTLTVGIESMAHRPEAAPFNYSMLRVIAPDGSRFAYQGCTVDPTRGPCRFHVKELPADGTYTLTVTPPQNTTVVGRLHIVEDLPLVSRRPDTQRIEAGKPAQVLRMTFDGKAGERVGLQLANARHSSKAPGLVAKIAVYRPNGTPWLTGMLPQGRDRMSFETSPLPEDGTYIVLIDPMYGTMSGDLVWSN
jgi:hypothetical protein